MDKGRRTLTVLNHDLLRAAWLPIPAYPLKNHIYGPSQDNLVLDFYPIPNWIKFGDNIINLFIKTHFFNVEIVF
jgi:hypothetical protein